MKRAAISKLIYQNIKAQELALKEQFLASKNQIENKSLRPIK